MLPSWCQPPERLVGRQAVLDEAMLETEAVTLVGPAGVGTTVAAGALLDRLVRDGRVERVAALRLNGCAGAPEMIWELGATLSAALPGDPASVSAALDNGPPCAVILDDADLSPDTAREVARLSERTLWVATGRSHVLGHPVAVPPLSDEEIASLLPEGTDPRPYRGLPLLTTLPSPPSAEDPWAAVDSLPSGAELLAELPTGLTGTTVPIPQAFLLPADGVVMRRAIREALGAEGSPSPAALAASLRERIVDLHRLACALVPVDPPPDRGLLRVAARRVADPELRALAAAAAARMSLHGFRPDDAANLARNALLRPLPPAARGVLQWVEGDALMAQGLFDEAHQSWVAASEALKDAGHKPVVAALARHCAAEHASRGHAERAREWLGLARAALGRHPERAALADAIRISADLAANAGELVGAEALYDEAAAAAGEAVGDRRAIAAVEVGQAALSASRGQFDEAARLLAGAAAAADTRPLRAAVAYRRAELALRRGDPNRAQDHEAVARAAWRMEGNSMGLSLCARMRGDLAALAGDRAAARAAWQEALALCRRRRDLAAVRRILRRLVAVEREGVPGPHVDALQETLDLAEVLGRAR